MLLLTMAGKLPLNRDGAFQLFLECFDQANCYQMALAPTPFTS